MVRAVLVALALGGSAGAVSGGAVVGPGPVDAVVAKSGYRVRISISPNQGGLVYNNFAVRCTRMGRPVVGAVSMRFTMRAMPMPSLTLRLRASAPGLYRGTGRKLTMPGRWEIRVRVVPRGGSPVEIVLVDRVAV